MVLVLVAWLLVLVAPLLPAGPQLQPLALSAVTVTSAGLTLLVAGRPGPHRRAWLLLGLGLAGYAGGFVVQFWVTAGERGGPGGLNLSDCSSLLLYPLANAGLLLLARDRAGRPGSRSMLEGAIVFCGASAVAIALVSAAYPSLLTGSVLDIVYALAYPVGGSCS